MANLLDNSEKVTLTEMLISLGAAFILTQIDFISQDKRVMMGMIYTGMVLAQVIPFVFGLKFSISSAKVAVSTLFIAVCTLYIVFGGDISEGITAIFLIVSTPHPYSIGWTLLKSFIFDSTNPREK